MKNRVIIIVLILIANSSFGQQFSDLSGDYLGQTPPGNIPVVFARRIVSTDTTMNHSSPAFSPNGNEVFWHLNRPPKVTGGAWLPSLTISMLRIGGIWTAPVISTYKGGPTFSPDGKRLYFEKLQTDTGIYPDDGPRYVEKEGDKWSVPKCDSFVTHFPELQFVIQSSITSNGTLYFLGYAKELTDNYNNKYGIYRAELINGKYAKPELLPPGINKNGNLNWTPYISPDESYLIFSSNRHNPNDGGDLYICFHDVKTDTWSEPVNMGEPVNTWSQERFPMVSADGKYLFFTRWILENHHNVFWVSAKIIDDLKKEVLNPKETK